MPLLFISHKHSDHKIAEVLAQFVEERSNVRSKSISLQALIFMDLGLVRI
jgi:hypothetical protein